MHTYPSTSLSSTVGSAGGILGGSVGSTLLGYLSASLDPLTGTTLVGHAYGGSLHTWRLDDTKLKQNQEEQQSTLPPEPLTTEERASLVHWRAKPCVTGHFRGVVDLSWETSQGGYLLSVSADQTCRLWAPVDDDDKIWLEVGRPQVHGYDLTAVASISTPSRPHLLVTAGDEKELRVFDAPKSTIELLQHTVGLKPSTVDSVDRVERAYIPSLGLSNKASAAESAEEEKPQGDEEETASNEAAATATTQFYLPLERDLGAVSLWPETRKLFGHQTELFCVTSTLAAQTSALYWDVSKPVLVASSCKARNVSDAAIRLWNVSQGKCHQVLQGGHKATVATLAFSPCGTYLASSGKDRRLCIWKRGGVGGTGTEDQFNLAWVQDSAHKRIIWSVHFCPWQPNCFVSSSRDGCIKLWQLQSSDENDDESKTTATVLHSFAPNFTLHGKPDSVTALSLRPTPYQTGVALLAVGLESGHLELWTIPTTTESDAAPPTCLMSNRHGHRATITKLAWKPQRDASSSAELLASSSMDHGVRIWKIQC
eukprot:scaffold7012_cov157-Amphora_coffeaeformis.AAC.13